MCDTEDALRDEAKIIIDTLTQDDDEAGPNEQKIDQRVVYTTEIGVASRTTKKKIRVAIKKQIYDMGVGVDVWLPQLMHIWECYDDGDYHGQCCSRTETVSQAV